MSDTAQTTTTPRAKRENDFVKNEVGAMSRILSALRSLPKQRRSAVMDYVNGLMNFDALNRAESMADKRPE